ncbi:hypothetical protein LTSEINV_6611 [Salmonella enterica subsp. enterica serovar Inverness str. R8-3668]|uniref:Uncharacterized protein n=3 Tax=Salmonella enterica I TaxID=59201 RepID=G5S0K5_SALET|nr:hypothetical protein LTSEINV_6611 [Salmonella enterica subsp. enterica serovar Inverness str. R8-3668]EHC81947.1 hypothetical protein LTSERUB_4939 [Salmonella enterica subsp. enterica serovar Rubislaw str. A4-653]EHC99723.1 hypothetical protein LTSEURB_4705 [Salmonella enterica subsp. enterica serovar Urbana str. R8-2977]
MVQILKTVQDNLTVLSQKRTKTVNEGNKRSQQLPVIITKLLINNGFHKSIPDLK